MADLMFDIDIDAPRGLIAFTLVGQWTPATIGAFRVALADAYDRLAANGHPRGSFLILSNSQTHGVQSQSITTSLAELAKEFEVVAKKTAVVVSGMLHRLQVQRVAPSDKIRIFTDPAEAKVWLFY